MDKFPILITPDGRSNARVLNAQKSGRIRQPAGLMHWFVQRVRIGDFVGAGATAQTITLATTYPRLSFPPNVMRHEAFIELRQTFSGGAVSACTVEVGDAGDTDGLLTATNVFTGQDLGLKFTVSAAEYLPRPEAEFSPVVRILTTSANVSALTQGVLDVHILFSPLVAA
jgi:hypothetical protein